MKTNFKNYLKKKKAQEIIDNLAKNCAGKKIILYGVNEFTEDIFKNCDLSKLNIIGISDRFFDNSMQYCGYKKIKSTELVAETFDILLISAYDDTDIKYYLKKELFLNKSINFKIKTLISMNFFEYVKGLIGGEF